MLGCQSTPEVKKDGSAASKDEVQIVVSRTIADGDKDILDAWVDSARLRLIMHNDGNGFDGSRFFASEVEARRWLVTSWRAARQDRPELRDPYLDGLTKIDEAGRLEEYVVAQRAQVGWIIPLKPQGRGPLAFGDFNHTFHGLRPPLQPLTGSNITAHAVDPLPPPLLAEIKALTANWNPPKSCPSEERATRVLASVDEIVQRLSALPLATGDSGQIMLALDRLQGRPDLVGQGVVLVSPELQRLLYQLGYCAVHRKDFKTGLHYLDRAIALMPLAPLVFVERLAALTGLGLHADVVEMANFGLDIAHGPCLQATLLRRKGYSLIELGRLQDALQAYQLAAVLDPGNKKRSQNEIDVIVARARQTGTPLDMTPPEFAADSTCDPANWDMRTKGTISREGAKQRAPADCPPGTAFREGACQVVWSPVPAVCQSASSQPCYEACVGGSLAACASLAWRASAGVGMDRDPVLGIIAESRACKLGAVQYCQFRDLVDELRLANANEKDKTAPARYACDHGAATSCFKLAKGLDPSLPEQATQAATLLERGCRDGHAPSCVELGRRLLAKEPSTEEQKRALALFEQACLSGDPNGCAEMANLYALGRGGEVRALPALRIYKYLCDFKFGSYCSLAGILLQEQPELGGGRAEILALFRTSCDLDWGDGCLEASRLLAQEGGTSEAEAQTLKEKACRLGVKEACAR